MVSRSATLFARAGNVAAGARSLWTRTTDAEKFQRVAQIPEPILLRDFFLRVTDGAGDVDEHDLTTPATDKMIVVFPGVTDLVVAAGSLQIHFVHEVEFFQEKDHSEDRGIIRLRPLMGRCRRLDFLQSHRPAGIKKRLDDASPGAGDSQALLSECGSDGLRSEWGLYSVHRDKK